MDGWSRRTEASMEQPKCEESCRAYTSEHMEIG
jgi:hypothetical protein